MQQFLFLELLDPEIHALLNGLKIEFGGKPTNTNIHITVRGPYQKPLPSKKIKYFERILRAAPILIHSAGLFENNNEFTVFLKIESPHLRQIWWKPDYPIEKYGFNPHISLFHSPDANLATCVLNFLKKEDIKLLCQDFHLTSYISKQQSLLLNESQPQRKHFLELANRRLVKADILQRASNIVKNCEPIINREDNIEKHK